MSDYNRIAAAIAYIKANFDAQPSLNEIAAHINVSPFHFQRMFTEWAGVSPKKFLQYISLQHAKKLLAQNQTVMDAAYETGFSGSSRLHDLFVNIEGMTPGEYKNGGELLRLAYTPVETPFGLLWVAASNKGITNVFFAEDEQGALAALQSKWPNATIMKGHSAAGYADHIARFFSGNWGDPEQLKLHLKGTPFQLKVWEALLKIPAGRLTTYKDIATVTGHPGASRAVGTAIGDNPVAYIIPCHRVIRATGIIGDYRWGSNRKTAIIGWESGKVYGEG